MRIRYDHFHQWGRDVAEECLQPQSVSSKWGGVKWYCGCGRGTTLCYCKVFEAESGEKLVRHDRDGFEELVERIVVINHLVDPEYVPEMRKERTMLINLTPHVLTLYDESGQKEFSRIAPAGQVARVKTTATIVGKVSIDGIEVPVVETNYGAIENLPDSKLDTIYIVSILVIAALRQQGISRNDVVAPDTGPESVVRDAEGRILGVRRFTR